VCVHMCVCVCARACVGGGIGEEGVHIYVC
jgi:hypothetical protein